VRKETIRSPMPDQRQGFVSEGGSADDFQLDR